MKNTNETKGTSSTKLETEKKEYFARLKWKKKKKHFSIIILMIEQIQKVVKHAIRKKKLRITRIKTKKINTDTRIKSDSLTNWLEQLL